MARKKKYVDENDTTLEQTTQTGQTTQTEQTEQTQPVQEQTNVFEMELPPVTVNDNSFEREQETVQETVTQKASTVTSDAEGIRGLLDDKGNPYDPTIHKFPAEKTDGGKWKKKPRIELKTTTQTADNGIQTEAIDGMTNEHIKAAAQRSAFLYASLHPLFLGPDAMLQNNDELMPLIASLERYYQIKGVIDMPPGIEVLVSMGMYSFCVIQRPTVKEIFMLRVKSVWSKIAPLIGFGKKKGDADNAQSDSGQK